VVAENVQQKPTPIGIFDRVIDPTVKVMQRTQPVAVQPTGTRSTDVRQ